MGLLALDASMVDKMKAEFQGSILYGRCGNRKWRSLINCPSRAGVPNVVPVGTVPPPPRI